MLVGVVGLGLIGGSFAKAYKKAGHTVLAYDTDERMLDFSIISGVVEGRLTDDQLPQCDLILVCTYPQAAIDFLLEKGKIIGKKPVVVDSCGTKLVVVDRCMQIAGEYGFTYVGGHPMAGTQFSGFKNSKEDMFVGAPMVIVPPVYDDVVFLDRVKELLKPAGFRSITVTTAEKHDEIIAFTSQLAHIVSNAYIKSPTAKKHKGVSAGSYKDMTRVAWLNPEMWAELFLDNKDNLIGELNVLIDNLQEYKDAIENDDRDKLVKLLDDGRRLKEEVDGK